MKTSVLNRACALVLLLLMFPVLFLIAVLIRVTSAGPLLMVEDLLPHGRAGLLRFRTTGPGTPEFRLIARLLRWCHYDEWPALWNVVQGHLTMRQLFTFNSRGE